MHNGVKSFMKSKAEFQIIYEVTDRRIKHQVISRDIF